MNLQEALGLQQEIIAYDMMWADDIHVATQDGENFYIAFQDLFDNALVVIPSRDAWEFEKRSQPTTRNRSVA